MQNIEKFKDIVLESLKPCKLKAGLYIKGAKIVACKDVSCTDCKERLFKWLTEEYKEPVLDDGEKKYLSSVIKPFRKNVSYIEKIHSKVDTYDYICVRVNRCEIMFFPKFEENTMYKGMELGRKYTLEELGL